jgi:hypothetical protein
LTTWFKADALSSLTNGQPVSLWPDASGNGDDATQSNSGNSPAFFSSVINGMPVVRFNSTNQTYLAFSRPVSGDFTIVCLFQSTQGLNSGTLFYQGAGLVSGEMPGVVNDFGTCLFANGSICAGTGSPDVAVDSGSGFNDGHPHIFTFTRQRNTGALALYVDGALAGTTIGGRESLTAPTQLVLGAQQTLLNFLTGDIAEVRIYNGALSDTDRIASENSLRCKYGLGSGAPPAPPANLTATTDNRSAFLDWSPAVAADDYVLYRSANAAGPFSIVTAGLAVTNYADSHAAGGRTNYYKVASVSECGTGAASAVVYVSLAAPALGFAADTSSGTFTVNWPTWGSNWTLWSATNLSPPITWTAVTNPVISTNGQLTVTIPIQQSGAFFRLTSP